MIMEVVITPASMSREVFIVHVTQGSNLVTTTTAVMISTSVYLTMEDANRRVSTPRVRLYAHVMKGIRELIRREAARMLMSVSMANTTVNRGV